MSEIRSLRALQLAQLTTLLRDVSTGLNSEKMGGYIGGRTAHYAYQERERWECDPTVERRKAYADRVAMEIRAEIAILNAISDDAYEQATRELPLDTWHPMSAPELVHYARGRGVEPGEWYERFKGFGSGHALMAGYCWYRLGTQEKVPLAERERIFGILMATESPKEAARVSGAYTGQFDPR
jgi:hypothetical protein